MNSESASESAPIFEVSYTPFPSRDDFAIRDLSPGHEIDSAPVLIEPPLREIFPSPIELFAAHYDRIVLALLVIQYVFVNLVFTTKTQNIVIMKELAAPFLSLLILGVWISGDLLTTGRWTLPRHGMIPAMVASLVYWGLLVPVSPSTASATEIWGRVCGFFIQIWAMARFVTTWQRARAVIITILATGVLMATYGFTQLMDNDILVAFGIIPDWGSHVFTTTAGCPCATALGFITILPLIVGILIASRGWKARLAIGALATVTVWEVVESSHRGAWIALAVTTPFLAVLALPWTRRAASAGRVLASVLGVVVLAAICWYGYLMYSNREMVRPTFARMAIDGATREPVIGRGLGTFNWLMPETRPSRYHRDGISHNTNHAHNELLNWFHDSGILGTAFAILMIGAYMVTGWRVLRRLSWTPRYWPALGAFLGPWNALVFSLFSVEALWAGPGVTAALVAGLAMAFGNLDSVAISEMSAEPGSTVPIRRTFRLRAASAMVLTVVFAAGYLLFAAQIRGADYHLRNNMAYTDGNAGSNAMAVVEAEEARRLNYMLPSNYYKLAYTYLVANKLPDAMNAYRDLQTFAPNYAQIHINLAFLNDQLGYKTASAWERERAAVLEHNTRNHRDAANYWMQLGDTTRAIPHLRMCSTIERDRTEAGYYYWFEIDNIAADLARTYSSAGREDLAKGEVERALRFNPNNLPAALLLIEVLQRDTQANSRDAAELRSILEEHAPDNPAVLVLRMQSALAKKDFNSVLDLAERASAGLQIPDPGVQPSQGSQTLGNSILQAVQVVFAENFDRPRCLEIAGWIYACQGRYGEAAPFLEQAFMATHNPRTAKRLGLVKARLAAPSRIP